MNVALPGLIVDVEARIDKLERGLRRANSVQSKSALDMERRARQSADRLRATYGQAGDGIAASLSKIAAPFVGGFFGGFSAAAISGVVRNISQITNGIAQIGDEAKRAGLEVETFQQWRFVADQNRIGIDALVDGFKELSLRSDEFIVTGKGSAAEAFSRLGLSADDLKTKLKNPSDLMLEIIGRLEGMDRAAQIRIADEIFGGSGGERFVELLSQGEAGLRSTMTAAIDAGAVLDRELIEKAAELDRKFSALSTSAGNFLKTIVVGSAEAIVELTDLRERIDNLFSTEAEGRAVLGDDLYNVLQRDRDLVESQAESLRALESEYQSLGEVARQASTEIASASSTVSAWGYDEQGTALAEAATRMRELADELKAGTIEADDFGSQMAEVQAKAKAAFDSLDAADKVNFSVAIGEVARLGGVIETVLSKAAALASTVAAAAGLGGTPLPASDSSTARRREDNAARITGQNTDNFLAAERAVNAKTSERLALEREIEGVRKRAAEAGAVLSPGQAEAVAQATIVAEAARRDASRPESAGAGGAGGGGGGGDGFGGAVADLQAETRALELQAAVLISTAAGGQRYGDVLEFARKKAELLAEAQRDGMTITPALAAQIDEVARAYVVAGESAEAASEKLANIKEAGERGAQAVGKIFESVLTGAKSAQEALGELLIEILKVQMQKQLTSAATGAGGGGFLSFLGSLLGFADGGYTGDGGRLEPAGLVHKGEFVMSKRATDRLGPANLAALHQSALRGYSDGGLVSGATQRLATSGGSSRSSGGAPIVTINSPVTVNASGGTPDQNADLAKQVAREIEGTMRRTIIDEITRQRRPGNALAQR